MQTIRLCPMASAYAVGWNLTMGASNTSSKEGFSVLPNLPNPLVIGQWLRADETWNLEGVIKTCSCASTQPAIRTAGHTTPVPSRGSHEGWLAAMGCQNRSQKPAETKVSGVLSEVGCLGSRERIGHVVILFLLNPTSRLMGMRENYKKKPRPHHMIGPGLPPFWAVEFSTSTRPVC